jgi:CheY-like chemotaxis protein
LWKNQLIKKQATMQRCLLVEDDLDDQEIFLMCLKSLNMNTECSVANNGREALEKFNAEPDYVPDFIFLDVNMPKMNGIECLREIRNIERLKTVKVYMYSTTSERSVIERSKELGATEFIVKPEKTSELKDKLYRILEICQHAGH